MDKEPGGRSGLLQIPLRTFLMSQCDKSSNLDPDIDVNPRDRACMSREDLLNLAVSEQITGRFEIIVRPVLALVIRHAVLS